ncbi:MAG: hypothetical protein NTV54_00635 [Ignavibacteriales bacterium]|nr:hypothetical protein [Ignavibacteriales bacterium]
MELALMIAQILVLLSLAGVAIYFVTVLMKVRGILGSIESDIREVSTRAIPVLENLEVITAKLRSITENFDDQMNIVRDSVQSIRTITDNIVDFERRVQEQIEAPVLEVAGVIGALISRIRGR